MPRLPTVCVIGAGSSGIAAAKALHQRGFDFDCFEKSDRVGGNWVFKNRNGMSSAYRSLHINTSRERMEFSDFPMPKSYPDFPHHTHIAEYFDSYVDHFGVRERITFETGVERAALGDGAWEVTLEGGDDAPLRRADGRQRPPLGRALAGAGVPGQRRVRGRADALARLHRATTRGSSATSASSCSGWATRRWTSPSSRASRRPPPIWPPGAARG